MDRYRYWRFIVLGLIFIVACPISLLTMFIFASISNWHAVAATLGGWFLIYVYMIGSIGSACRYYPNYTKIETMIREERNKDFMVVVTCGIYPSIVLFFMVRPWEKWVNIFPFTAISVLPWVNSKQCDELIATYHIPEEVLDKTKATDLYRKGKLVLFIFDYINDCGVFAKK